MSCVFRGNACAISDPENQQVIITGGGDPEIEITANVTVYGHRGWVEDLPNMNYKRAEHGCTSYLSQGKRVSLLSHDISSESVYTSLSRH